ncbi:MAG: AAA family ATPase [Pyrinomonadaceae bacterium]|nr:AAA family ATPase [Pyrinomonadaceae bacterium]
MITSIHYKNFKALQDATLPLGRFTLIVGANGTGKSTAVKSLEMFKSPARYLWNDIISKSLISNDSLSTVDIESDRFGNAKVQFSQTSHKGSFSGNPNLEKLIIEFRLFSFDSSKISAPVPIQANTILEESGRGLAGVLDQLRDSEPERFEELNAELNRWFYEYDRILFEVPADGQKSFLLRTTVGKHKIKASELSDGTLLALAYLTIAYLPNPPKIVAFEEPEKGIHPRLLRNIQEAMYRLAYPENYGEKREPIQVIATTHSPYLLDLFKDNPEEIVISSKDEKGVHFERLIDKPHIKEILQDAPLGEIWYSGVLGGVPAHI